MTVINYFPNSKNDNDLFWHFFYLKKHSEEEISEILEDKLRKEVFNEQNSLIGNERVQLFKLLCKYKGIFNDKLRLSNQCEYNIKMYNSEPVIKRNYPTTFNLLPFIEQEITRMLNLGIIKEAQ